MNLFRSGQVAGVFLTAALAAGQINMPAVAQSQTRPAPKAMQTEAMKFSKAAETWAGIVADRKALGQAVTAGNLAEVHDLAFAIRDGVVTLPYKSAALTAAKRNALEKRVQEVAVTADEIDRVADAGNLAATKVQHTRLLKSLAAIEAIYPPNTLPTTGAKPMSAAERELFLTPGGTYTTEDINANGNTSVYQKHPSYVAAHNTEVKSGEAVCPISETKPDPKLTWIIGGKTYQFCCPPCVAEFVAKAKKSPQSIKTPEAYIKK